MPDTLTCRNPDCGAANPAGRRKCRRCRRVLRPLSRGERAAVAAIAANSRWARVKDRSRETAKARENGPASIGYWLREVDPDHEMSDHDRQLAAENARAAWYGRRMKDARAARRT